TRHPLVFAGLPPQRYSVGVSGTKDKSHHRRQENENSNDSSGTAAVDLLDVEDGRPAFHRKVGVVRGCAPPSPAAHHLADLPISRVRVLYSGELIRVSGHVPLRWREFFIHSPTRQSRTRQLEVICANGASGASPRS